jgi:hypothetical protein
VIGRLKGWPLLGVTLISCGIDFNAYFNTYYNLKNLAGRIDKLEEIGDNLYLPDAVFYMRSIRESRTKISFPKGQKLNLEGHTDEAFEFGNTLFRLMRRRASL